LREEHGIPSKQADTTPYHSDWIRIEKRQYAAFAVPAGLPTWVPRWLNGDLISSIVAAVLYGRVDESPYASRLYWKKNVFYNLGAPWHLALDEHYQSMSEAKARARENTVSLKAGRVPGSSNG
jgi:hypothetical protein